MRGRAVIPMVAGLVVGVIALKVFVNVLQKAKGATVETVPVVFATTNIEPTLEILDNMVEIRHMAKDAVPDSGFAAKTDVVGRVTSWPIPKGSPIGAMQLAPKNTPPGMAVRIPDGYRAVAVKIDESAGVAGWIKPGSHVDVVALLSATDRSKQSISKVILQNVVVLAVGQDIGKSSETAATLSKSITLAVNPNDVPKLHLAETKGKLRLAMRNQRDSSMGKENPTTDNDLVDNDENKRAGNPSAASSFLRSLLGGQAKIEPKQTDKEKQPEPAHLPPVTAHSAAPASQPWAVEVIRGADEVEKISFESAQPGARRLETETTGAARGKRPKAAPSAAAAPPGLATPVSMSGSGIPIPLGAAQIGGPGLGGPAQTQ